MSFDDYNDGTDDMDQEPSEEMIAEWEHEEHMADMYNTEEEPCLYIKCCKKEFCFDDSDPALMLHILKEHNGTVKLEVSVRSC